MSKKITQPFTWSHRIKLRYFGLKLPISLSSVLKVMWQHFIYIHIVIHVFIFYSLFIFFFRKWYASVIVLGIITTLCLTSFLLLMFCSCSCRCRNEQVLCSKNNRRKFTKLPLQLPSGDLSDSFSETEIYPMKNLPKSWYSLCNEYFCTILL